MDTTAEQLAKIEGSLESLTGTTKSLAMKVENNDGKADEAWTLYDALRAVRSDVQQARSELEG